MGRDSSVGVAARDGLDGSGIESRWGRDYLHLSRMALGSSQLPVQWVPGLYQGVKRAGRGVEHPFRLKNVYSYISTPHTGLRGLLESEFYI